MCISFDVINTFIKGICYLMNILLVNIRVKLF